MVAVPSYTVHTTAVRIRPWTEGNKDVSLLMLVPVGLWQLVFNWFCRITARWSRFRDRKRVDQFITKK